MDKINTTDVIDAHAYLDESRVSAMDLDYLAKKNNISTIVVSPACTKNHEPDKHPAMYWVQRLILKTPGLRVLAAWISSSFYDNEGELRPIWRLFTRDSKDLIKVMHPENEDLLQKISPYKEKLKMWFWLNPSDHTDFTALEKLFANDQIFGLKIHAYWHNVDLGSVGEYVQFCKKMNCPLYVILGYGRSGDISSLIESCDGINVILGYGAFPIFSHAWRKIRSLDNFYIDLTSFHLDRSLIRKAFRMLGPEKCIFGTDCPYNFYDEAGNFSYDKTFERIYFDFLKPAEYDRVLRGNIKRISRS